ncbi:MAG: polysaccharide pyruvyl transferase family protein [Candidatus Bathyarchaeota archaeon]|nr:polysaccharide pyruvyl transferase family protein [Candidatus Bathyarchaeum sp.]
MSKIFWIGCFPPSSHSVGDHAQTLAIERLLGEHFSDYEVKRFYRTEAEEFFLEDVKSDDLIFIHSSGDFGDLYKHTGWHEIRKRIIETYPNNRVVQLPVSVCYKSNANFEADKIFFSDKRNLLLLCRSEESTELLRNNFGCRVEFFPDFVFSLKPPKPSGCVRRGTLVVLRSDKESSIRPQLHRRLDRRGVRKPFNLIFNLILKKRIRTRFQSAFICDTQVSEHDITDANREKTIYDRLEFFQRFELVITDRFHGCVFAYLTKTPFEVVSGKIQNKTKVSLAVDYPSYFKGFRELVFSELDASPVSSSKESTILGLIKSRRSIRKWNNSKVESEKISKILEAGVYAPSAANLQATKFKVLSSRKDIKFVCQNTSPWFKNSLPDKAVLVLYDSSSLPREKWTERFVWQDTACAMMNMMLVAESLGLKSCWASVNLNQEKTIKANYGIGKHYVLACMLFLGYSDQKPSLKSRHQGRILERHR